MTLTKAAIEEYQQNNPAKVEVPIDTLIAIYTKNRMDILSVHQPPFNSEVKKRLQVTQSVEAYLNLLKLVSKTRQGRKVLKELGITVI